MTIEVVAAMMAFVGDTVGAPGLEPGNAVWTRAQRHFPSLRQRQERCLMHDLSDVYEAAYKLPADQHHATYAAAQLAELQRRFMHTLRAHDAIRPHTYVYFHTLTTLHYQRLCDKLRRTRPAFRQGSRIRRRAHVKGTVEHTWIN